MFVLFFFRKSVFNPVILSLNARETSIPAN